MRLTIYLGGDRVLDESGRVEIRRGPLFCEIDFVGDGTPGHLTYHPVDSPKRAHSEERLARLRQGLEDRLKAPARIVQQGGSVRDGETVAFHDQTATVRPWTPEHMGSVVMEYLAGSCQFALEGFPSRIPRGPKPAEVPDEGG